MSLFIHLGEIENHFQFQLSSSRPTFQKESRDTIGRARFALMSARKFYTVMTRRSRNKKIVLFSHFNAQQFAAHSVLRLPGCFYECVDVLVLSSA